MGSNYGLTDLEAIFRVSSESSSHAVIEGIVKRQIEKLREEFHENTNIAVRSQALAAKKIANNEKAAKREIDALKNAFIIEREAFQKKYAFLERFKND